MAKMYLLGSDVETNKDRERPRLCGIANETFVAYSQAMGYLVRPVDGTMYCFPVKEKMLAMFDENDEPILDMDGQQAYQGTGDYCMEVDTDTTTEIGKYYDYIPTVHISRLKSRETMETAGWFTNE